MNAQEAREYGRRVRKRAEFLVEIGDCATVVLNQNWQVADKASQLGIMNSHGVADIHGEVARAFREGFGKSRA